MYPLFAVGYSYQSFSNIFIKYNQKIPTLKSLISKVKKEKKPVKKINEVKKIKEEIVKSEDRVSEDEKAIKKQNIASFFG